MKPKYEGAFVQLSGEDGNAGAIMGRVSRELKANGASDEEVKAFRLECFNSESYNDLLINVQKWVNVG